jgi:protocatechuate 3,4-dioxygenase beta subunit
MRGVECAELHRDFVLEAGVRVAGVVSDSETGLPIEGVEILLGRPGSPSNGRTDADGRYALRIAREEAGFRDSLRAIASGFAVGEHEVQAFSDDPIRLDFQLRRGRSAKGRVLGPDDRPVSGAIVIAKGWGMESIDPVSDRCRVRTAADGTFEIPNLAEAAHHWLFLRKEGCGTKAFDFPHDEASRTSIDFGDLRLPEPATILAEIVDEEGKGIADILVGLDGANSDHDRFGLVNQYLAGTLSRMARSDDRGRVGFSDLAAGTYTLRVNGAFASRGNPYSELRVDEGESREGVRLVLRLGLAIEGRVVDPSGGPVPGVSVMCIRERSGQDPAEFEDAEDVARGDGSFRLRGLREGKYTLLVSTILPPGENGAGDLASARWRSISAGASGLSLTLPVAAWIEGKVVGTDGAPVAGAHIQSEGVEDEDADVFAPTSAAETDAQGRFRLRVGAGSRGNLQAYVRGEFFAEAKDVRAGAQGVVLRPSSPR